MKSLVLLSVLCSVATTSFGARPTEIRPLQWGELNIIHTTDTHGWLPGHLLQPEFGADWGDYISFITQMRRRADERGVDVLVVDSGDRHDGNGLSDATKVDGEVSQQVFMQADLDVVVLGNHELYKNEIIQQEYDLLAAHYGDRFLTSNVDILDNGEWKSVGNRYKMITTKNQGLKVLTFGFLYDFVPATTNARVRIAKEVVLESWFTEAMTQQCDVILLATHIPVSNSPEIDTIIKAVRKQHPHTPIQLVGGHSHIRDYKIYDDQARGLQSGRFMETIGWASIDKIRQENGQVRHPAEFARSYLDSNTESYSFHSNTTATKNNILPTSKQSFDTDFGLLVSRNISQFRRELDLNKVLGCVPHNYYINREPYPSQFNIYSLITDKIMPMIPGGETPRMIMTNTGGIRYDLMKGPFTKDSGFIVSPFPSRWFYISQVPRQIALMVMDSLNRRDQVLQLLDLNELGIPVEFDNRVLGNANINGDYLHNAQHSFSTNNGYSLGYVTHDDLGTQGDDTPHRAWSRYPIPNVVAHFNKLEGAETIDMVFNDFMAPFVKASLLQLGHTAASVEEYGGDTIIDLLPEYFGSCEFY